MFLTAVPSTHCSLHQVRVPYNLMLKLGIEQGDWLIFDTSIGPVSLFVCTVVTEDVNTYGKDKVFICKDSTIFSRPGKTVTISKHGLTIGADPEFYVITDKGTHVPAHTILDFNSQIGCDGELGELRPDYALSPEQLTVNIGRLVRKIKEKLPANMFPISGSFLHGRASGFHVHLGIPEELVCFAANNTDKIIKNIVETLDYYVGIPSMFVDPDCTRRLDSEYGQYGDYRVSRRTLEYRVPGGYHLGSPSLTLSLLSSAFILVDDILRRITSDSNGWTSTIDISSREYFEYNYSLPSEKEIKTVFCSKDKNILGEEVKEIQRKLFCLSSEDDKKNINFNPRDTTPLLIEWFINEAKPETYVHEKGQQAMSI